MKKWIRNKLTKFLRIDALDEEIAQEFNKLHSHINTLESKLDRFNSYNNELLKTNEFILNQFNISADLGANEYHKNWAVICVKGKPEYVKFVDLSNRDIRDIAMYIRRFEGTNRIIDSPFDTGMFFR